MTGCGLICIIICNEVRGQCWVSVWGQRSRWMCMRFRRIRRISQRNRHIPWRIHDAIDAFHDAIDAFHDAIDTFCDAFHDAIDAFHDAIDAFHDAIEAFHDAIDAFHDAIDAFHNASVGTETNKNPLFLHFSSFERKPQRQQQVYYQYG